MAHRDKVDYTDAINGGEGGGKKGEGKGSGVQVGCIKGFNNGVFRKEAG